MFFLLCIALPMALMGNFQFKEAYPDVEGLVVLEYALDLPQGDISQIELEGKRMPWRGRLKITPVLEGQEYRVVFFDASGNPKMHKVFVPFPIVVGGKEKAVNITSIDMSGLYFQLSFRGFQVGEEVEISSHTAKTNETMRIKLPPSLHVMHGPAIQGQEFGREILVISAEGFQFSTSIRWGSEGRAVSYEDWMAKKQVEL